MNTYHVQCVAFPLPIERLRAANSFIARKDYAERNGCQLTDCYAKRIWDESNHKWPREKPIRNIPSLDKYTKS